MCIVVSINRRHYKPWTYTDRGVTGHISRGARNMARCRLRESTQRGTVACAAQGPGAIPSAAAAGASSSRRDPDKDPVLLPVTVRSVRENVRASRPPAGTNNPNAPERWLRPLLMPIYTLAIVAVAPDAGLRAPHLYVPHLCSPAGASGVSLASLLPLCVSKRLREEFIPGLCTCVTGI